MWEREVIEAKRRATMSACTIEGCVTHALVVRFRVMALVEINTCLAWVRRAEAVKSTRIVSTTRMRRMVVMGGATFASQHHTMCSDQSTTLHPRELRSWGRRTWNVTAGLRLPRTSRAIRASQSATCSWRTWHCARVFASQQVASHRCQAET